MAFEKAHSGVVKEKPVSSENMLMLAAYANVPATFPLVAHANVGTDIEQLTLSGGKRSLSSISVYPATC